MLCHPPVNSVSLFWRMRKWPIFCRVSWFFFSFTKVFPSMVAAAREGPLGNHVDQNLTKRLFDGACIFFPTCSLPSLWPAWQASKGEGKGGKWKKELGREEKRLPSLSVSWFSSPSLPSPPLSLSPFLHLPRRLSLRTEKNAKTTAHSASAEADLYPVAFNFTCFGVERRLALGWTSRVRDGLKDPYAQRPNPNLHICIIPKTRK